MTVGDGGPSNNLQVDTTPQGCELGIDYRGNQRFSSLYYREGPLAQWLERGTSQLTQNICITFIQCWTNVEDVGPTLYKCYTNVCWVYRCRCLPCGFEPRWVQDFQTNFLLLPSQSWDAVSLLCPWATHFTLKYFTWLWWKWLPGRTKMAMCTVSPMRWNGCRIVCSPWSWNGTRMNRSSDQGVKFKVGCYVFRLDIRLWTCTFFFFFYHGCYWKQSTPRGLKIPMHNIVTT